MCVCVCIFVVHCVLFSSVMSDYLCVCVCVCVCVCDLPAN